MRHVAQRVQYQVVQIREQWLGTFRKYAEIGEIRSGPEAESQNANITVLRRDRHDARSNHLEGAIHWMQGHLRNRADGRSTVKNVSKRVFQSGDGFRRRINGKRRSL